MEFNYDIILDEEEETSILNRIKIEESNTNEFIELHEGLIGGILTVSKGIGKIVKFFGAILIRIKRLIELVFSIFFSKINKLKLRNKYMAVSINKHRAEYLNNRIKYNTRVPFDHYGSTDNLIAAIADCIKVEHKLVDVFYILADGRDINSKEVAEVLQNFVTAVKYLTGFAENPAHNTDVINIYAYGGELRLQNSVIINNGNDNKKVIDATKRKIDNIKTFIDNQANNDPEYVKEHGNGEIHQKGIEIMKDYLKVLPKFKEALVIIADTQLATTILVTKQIEHLSD